MFTDSSTPTNGHTTQDDAVRRPRLSVVIGSIRPDRFGPTVATWFAKEAERHGGFTVDVVDLADFDLPVELGGNDPNATPPDDVKRLGARLGAADAHVLVTPVYNRSYPASLKTAIDWLFGEWVLRPVSFISYGGVSGGLESIDHLRGVFPEFPAVLVKNYISVPSFWTAFDYDGRPVKAEELRAAATGVLDELAWWAPMLREARRTRPYPALDFELEEPSEPAPPAENAEVRA